MQITGVHIVESRSLISIILRAMCDLLNFMMHALKNFSKKK